MTETIKETYQNIQNYTYNILNSYIGSSISNKTQYIKNIEYQIKQTIKNYYPNVNLILKIDIDYNNILHIDINATSNYFPIMDMKNFKTHDFIESNEFYFNQSMLKCSKCNLYITEKGNLVEGDFTCDEYVIKQIIE